MALSPKESIIFSLTEADFASPQSPVMQASWDFRLREALDILEGDYPLEGVNDLVKESARRCAMIANDYYFEPEQMMAALKLARERRQIGQA